MANLAPSPKFQAYDANGNPLTGGKLHTYLTGTSTPATTYTDSGGGTANANPVILDSRGEADVWLTVGVAYRYTLKTAADVTIWTVDGITGSPSSADLQNGTINWVAAGGTADAITATYASALTTLVDGQLCFFRATAANATTTPTFAPNGLTARTITKDGGGALNVGDIPGNLAEVILRYNLANTRWELMNPSASTFGLRNRLPNPSAYIAQRSDAGLTINLTTSRLVGGVDACALWASGGAVSAGTITQLKTSIAGTTGYAARAAGVTLTGSGVISHAVRMKSSDARSYKNKTASFQISVAHDVGSNINYTVILKKATAEDNWSSMTTIATSGATSVPTATGTIVKFENQALGDVSNGMEIEVQAACGAVTTKNLDFTEWSLDIGAVAPIFNGNSYEIDEAECLTYLPGWVSNGGGATQIVAWAYANTTTSAIGGIEFSGAKARITPTGILAATATRFTFATNGTTFVGSAIAFSTANRSKGTVNLTVSGATGGQGGQIYCNNIPGYIFFTGAELF